MLGDLVSLDTPAQSLQPTILGLETLQVCAYVCMYACVFRHMKPVDLCSVCALPVSDACEATLYFHPYRLHHYSNHWVEMIILSWYPHNMTSYTIVDLELHIICEFQRKYTLTHYCSDL